MNYNDPTAFYNSSLIGYNGARVQHVGAGRAPRATATAPRPVVTVSAQRPTVTVR